MSTCDCRVSAKSSTGATSAKAIGAPEASSTTISSGTADLRRRNCLRTEGSWVTTIKAPPTATPTAAERTPSARPARTSP